MSIYSASITRCSLLRFEYLPFLAASVAWSNKVLNGNASPSLELNLFFVTLSLTNPNPTWDKMESLAVETSLFLNSCLIFEISCFNFFNSFFWIFFLLDKTSLLTYFDFLILFDSRACCWTFSKSNCTFLLVLSWLIHLARLAALKIWLKWKRCPSSVT